jgi:large subunit ribosomal protein L13
LDLKDKIVGRMAPKIVEILRGKNKNNFLPNLDLGDYVVLINAKYITFTGNNKLDKEIYYNHSGYPGGLRERSTRLMLEKYPRELVFRIIKGMMPHTKLGNKQTKRLFIYPESQHNQQAQEKEFVKIELYKQ